MSILGIHNYDKDCDWWYNENGFLHREDGPAITYANGDNGWFLNGKCHRVDGPAIERTNGTKEYWINGVQYSSLEEGLMDQAIG